MNYYKQGDVANADKIKAAFENKGYSDKGFTFDVNNILFFTANNKHINVCPANGWLANIILTHPDYKELELPVEQLFKVGDWLYHNTCGVRPILVKDYSERRGYKVECIGIAYYLQKGVIEKEYHLWSMADAKDGDVLVTTKIRNCPFIYRKTDRKNNLAYYYAGIDGDGNFSEGCLKRTLCHFGLVSDVIPATKEQRDLLFQKMKEAGYEWDVDKKELRKIKSHYNIANFKPKQWVLVRQGDGCAWRLDIFSNLKEGAVCQFECVGNSMVQCIPFNDDTKHLLGTTDMCDEMYINW